MLTPMPLFSEYGYFLWEEMVIALYISIGLPYYNITLGEIEEDLETYHRLKWVLQFWAVGKLFGQP